MTMIPPLKCSNPNCTLEVFDGAHVDDTCPCGGMYATVEGATILATPPPPVEPEPEPEPEPTVKAEAKPEPLVELVPPVEPEPPVTSASEVVSSSLPVTDELQPARKTPVAIVATVIVGLLITAVAVVLMVNDLATDANDDTATADNPLAPPVDIEDVVTLEAEEEAAPTAEEQVAVEVEEATAPTTAANPLAPPPTVEAEEAEEAPTAATTVTLTCAYDATATFTCTGLPNDPVEAVEWAAEQPPEPDAVAVIALKVDGKVAFRATHPVTFVYGVSGSVGQVAFAAVE